MKPPSATEGPRHAIPCFCGLWRSLPAGVVDGDIVRLTACPRCGASPTLRFLGHTAELLPASPAPSDEALLNLEPSGGVH